MFDPHCPTCDRRMLLGSRRVERIDQTPEGPVVHLRCFCNTAVVWPSAPVFTNTPPVEVPTPA